MHKSAGLDSLKICDNYSFSLVWFGFIIKEVTPYKSNLKPFSGKPLHIFVYLS